MKKKAAALSLSLLILILAEIPFFTSLVSANFTPLPELPTPIYIRNDRSVCRCCTQFWPNIHRICNLFPTTYEINYQGYIRSLNLADGHLNWETPISNTAANPSVLAINLTLTTNRVLYVTTFSDLYGVNVDSGKVQLTKNFTYWVLPPAYGSGKLFVAADLKIIAYE